MDDFCKKRAFEEINGITIPHADIARSLSRPNDIAACLCCNRQAVRSPLPQHLEVSGSILVDTTMEAGGFDITNRLAFCAEYRRVEVNAADASAFGPRVSRLMSAFARREPSDAGDTGIARGSREDQHATDSPDCRRWSFVHHHMARPARFSRGRRQDAMIDAARTYQRESPTA